MRRRVSLVVILALVVLLASYSLYQWRPRRFALFWPRILAHVHQGPPGVPNCLPNDLEVAGDPDLHDAWAAPPSTHDVQHLEWLGDCVSEEAAPRANDTFDDGLRAIQVPAQGAWQPNSRFQLRVLVSTAFTAHPRWFRGGNVSLAVFADWNANGTFERGELIHSWVGAPPFAFAPANPDFTIVTTPQIAVPANYATPGTQPSFRLRTVFVNGNAADVNPGGAHRWGEVEDYGEEPLIEG